MTAAAAAPGCCEDGGGVCCPRRGCAATGGCSSGEDSTRSTEPAGGTAAAGDDTSDADRRKIIARLAKVNEKVARLENALARAKADSGLPVDDPEKDEKLTKPYLKGRQELDEELERSLNDVPFERFELMSGQGRKRCDGP